MIINGEEFVKKSELEKNSITGEKLTNENLIGNSYFFRTVTFHITGVVTGTTWSWSWSKSWSCI